MSANRAVEFCVDVFIFGGALWISLATIKGMIRRNLHKILDALAGRPQAVPSLHANTPRPRLFASPEPDRWRTVGRRRAIVLAEPSRTPTLEKFDG